MAAVDCARCDRKDIDPTEGCPACGNEDHLLPPLDDAAWREMVEAAIIDLTQRVYALEQFGTRVTPDGE